MNRGVGGAEGIEHASTLLKIVKVLGAAKSDGVLQYFVRFWLRSAAAARNDEDEVLRLINIRNASSFCCLFVVLIYDIYNI